MGSAAAQPPVNAGSFPKVVERMLEIANVL